MSDDTYYTVLGVSETATQPEIRAAYRNLIKQVHPDTIATLSPYLKGMAEEKAKEMTEAYSIISDVTKRRQYDRLIAEHRHQSAPATPPPAPRNSPVAAQPQVSRRQGYSWQPMRRWVGRHPVLACSLGAFTIVGIVSLLPNSDNTAPSQSRAAVVANNAPQSQYSAFPCEATQKVSPIDHKPCKATTAVLPYVTKAETAQQTVPAPPPGVTVDEGSVRPDAGPTGSGHTIAGMYFGTVHNKTADLTATFGALLQQKDGTILDGCVDVKPPLYGSGLLHGVARGSRVEFNVNNIRFQGESSGKEVVGSYIVSKGGGVQELGDFLLARKTGEYPEYSCADGRLTEVQTHIKSAAIDLQPGPTEKPHPKPVAVYATVGGYYTTIYKRCKFLPTDNYGRCNFGPEIIATLKSGDRVRVLSPEVRAESGDDIYKVRTQQGWEGWIDSRGVTIETQ